MPPPAADVISENTGAEHSSPPHQEAEYEEVPERQPGSQYLHFTERQPEAVYHNVIEMEDHSQTPAPTEHGQNIPPVGAGRGGNGYEELGERPVERPAVYDRVRK